MTKTLISAALLACTFITAGAQGSFASNPGGLYLKGGVNFSNISVTSDGGVNSSNALTTFNVGFIGDIPVADIFSFQTGLYLNGKGSKAQSANYDVTFNPLYLELPVNFVLKFPVDKHTRFFAGAGPYLAMGIGGKTKGTSNVGGVYSTYEQNIQFSSNGPDANSEQDASVNQLRRFDYGVNFLAGVEVQRLMLGVGYQLGLAKIGATQNNNNDENKYRIFSINAGIRL
jgi:hypothetical protein